MQEISVDASIDQIRTVTNFVNDELKALGCSLRVRILIDVAIDELFSNIVRYAYGTKPGPVTVRVDSQGDPPSVVVTFIDRGFPYDPVSAEFVDTTRLPAKVRPIGGLGVYMVKKSMDDMSYSYRDGQNILSIRKRI